MLIVMAERATDGTEPPRAVAAALAACDVFIAPTIRSLSHTSARKRASDAGARGATMPGVTEDDARARDGDRLRRDGGAVEGGRGRCSTAARGRTSRARAAPISSWRSTGAAGIVRRRRTDRAGRVRQPAVRRGVHRAGVRGGDARGVEPRARSGSASEPADADRREGRIVAADGGLGPAVHRAAARARRARAPTSPSSASAPTTRRC